MLIYGWDFDIIGLSKCKTLYNVDMNYSVGFTFDIYYTNTSTGGVA